jgi:hypothetical protein
MSNLPTIPGYYVSITALQNDDLTDPYGATIWVLDDEDGERYEYSAWSNEDSDLRVYPEGLESAVEKYGWTMVRLVVE